MRGNKAALTEDQVRELVLIRRALAQLPTIDQLAARMNRPRKVIKRYLFAAPEALPKRHAHLIDGD